MSSSWVDLLTSQSSSSSSFACSHSVGKRKGSLKVRDSTPVSGCKSFLKVTGDEFDPSKNQVCDR